MDEYYKWIRDRITAAEQNIKKLEMSDSHYDAVMKDIEAIVCEVLIECSNKYLHTRPDDYDIGKV